MSKNYKQELEDVQKVKCENNSFSYRKLLGEYMPLINSITNSFVNKFPNIPLCKEDIRNQLNYYFYQTILEYEIDSKTNFATYTKQFMVYKLYNYVRKFLTKNNQVQNHNVEFEDYKSTNSENPSSILIEEYIQSQFRNIPNLINSEKLSDCEKKVLKCILDNKNVKEIAIELHRTEASIYLYKKSLAQKINKLLQN